MTSKTNKSKDRFQLASTHTSVNIEVGGKVNPLEVKLHIIYYDHDILLNLLYLSQKSKQEEGWLVGFDSIADKVCPFSSKLEIALALKSLTNSLHFTTVLASGIDISLCRKLIEDISSKSKGKAEESLHRLCNLLNINILADESAISNDLPIKSIEGSSLLQGEVRWSQKFGQVVKIGFCS